MSNHRNAALPAETRTTTGARAAGWVLVLAVLTGGGFAAHSYAADTCPTTPASSVCQLADTAGL